MLQHTLELLHAEINEPSNQSARTKQQLLVCRSGNKPALESPCHRRNQTRSPGELVPQAHRPLESGPRNAPLTQCVGSHPSHERCGHDGIPRRMRAQHQTQMTVHVRKLNRGMNNNQSACKQSSTTKAGPPGRSFKRIQEIKIKSISIKIKSISIKIEFN